MRDTIINKSHTLHHNGDFTINSDHTRHDNPPKSHKTLYQIKSHDMSQSD